MSLSTVLFRPGMNLMHRMPLRFKLWLLLLLVAIPVIATMAQVIQRDIADLRCARLAVSGADLNRKLVKALSLTYLGRDAGPLVTASDALVAAREDKNLIEGWQSMQAWMRAQRQAEPGDEARNIEGLQRATWRALIAGGYAFHLFTESIEETAIVVDLIHERLPLILTAALRLRLAVSGQSRDRAQVSSLQNALAAAVEQAVVVRSSGTPRGVELEPSLQAVVDSARDIEGAHPDLLDSTSLDSLINFTFSAHDEFARNFHGLLVARANTLSTGVLAQAAVASLALLLLSYALISMMRAMSESVQTLRDIIHHVADGELRYEDKVPGRDAIARLGVTLDEMTEDLSVRVGKIRSEAIAVWMAADSIADANRELLDRTELTAASLTQTTSSVQALDKSVSETASSAQQTQGLVTQVKTVAEGSVGIVGEAVQTMQALQIDAGKMVEIIGAIDGIAFQTNILALNASVEAARAGVAGRGFAVVAEEVRSLAQRCAESAHQVRELIERSNARVEKGAIGIEAVSRSLDEIVGGVRQAAENIAVIAGSAVTQSGSLHEITEAVNRLESLSQMSATMVDRSLRAAEALSLRSSGLSEAVHGMRLRFGTADEAYEMLIKAKEFLEKNGLAVARSAMHDANGEFQDRDLYIFGFDRERNFEIYGSDPSKTVNTKLEDLDGVDGMKLFNDACQAADVGGGWVEYNVRSRYNGRVVPKISYVLAVGNMILGCGVYKPVPKHERETGQKALLTHDRQTSEPAAVTGAEPVAA
ncbi:MAG: methyl-accepting chemotaxis protein [Burkholderiaceae bacterium]